MLPGAANEEQYQQPKLFDVILSGGPPWGFTLSGGSEFGSKLYVKKVILFANSSFVYAVCWFAGLIFVNKEIQPVYLPVPAYTLAYIVIRIMTMAWSKQKHLFRFCLPMNL